MEPVYEVLCTRSRNEELESYITYGLRACAEGQVIKSIADISVDYEKVMELAKLCNAQKVSLCHIEDVVEDWLN